MWVYKKYHIKEWKKKQRENVHHCEENTATPHQGR
jgi:hypothetical protein